MFILLPALLIITVFKIPTFCSPFHPCM